MGSLNCKNCNCKNKNSNDDNELINDNQMEDNEINFPEQHPNGLQNKGQMPIKNNPNDFFKLNNNEFQSKDNVNTLTGGTFTPNNNNSNNSPKYDFNCTSLTHANRKDIFSNQSDIMKMDINENDDNFKSTTKDKHSYYNSNITNNNVNNSNMLSQREPQLKGIVRDNVLFSNKNEVNNKPLSQRNINSSNCGNNNSNIKSMNPTTQSVENKIQFGLDKDAVSPEERKLIEEAQKNLNQFYPPEQNEENALQKKLSKIELDSFIPQNKIKNISNSNEVFFHGELKKLINYEVSAHKPQLYSSRFCTLTKTSFYYYKSKETYLRKQRPLCVVPLTQITKVSFAKIKKTSKRIDHIIICNKLGIIKNNKEELERCKLFQDLDLNACMTSASESGESLIIFTSEIEQSLFRWFIVLNYLLDRLKDSEGN